MNTPTRVASIDIGTNSVRLLVAQGIPGTRAIERLQREMRVTRLGEGLVTTGRLGERALRDTVAVLTEYAAIWQAHAVPEANVAIFATAAARDAANGVELLERIARATGVQPRIISGEWEATIGLLGATFEDASLPPFVLDIGGGSTEISVGADLVTRADTPATQPATRADIIPTVAAQCSLHLGVVTLTEKAAAIQGHPGPPFSEPAREAIIHTIDTTLLPGLAQANIPKTPTIVAVAGTIAALVIMHLDLDTYDPEVIHHTILTRDIVDDFADKLWRLPPDGMGHLRAIEAGRADIVPAGTLLLSRVMHALDATHVIASEADSLDGQCIATLTNLAPPPRAATPMSPAHPRAATPTATPTLTATLTPTTPQGHPLP